MIETSGEDSERGRDEHLRERMGVERGRMKIGLKEMSCFFEHPLDG